MTSHRMENMDDQPYLNREIDEFLADLRNSLQRIEIQTTTTNGKVRKLIVALVLVGGIVIGQTATNYHEIIGLVAGFLH